ncbi:MAG: PocR ligand-binding domain-containing protein, partial [Clostridia bacterium]|nr:PocR ligand-binding domain-containing protein [Clostridia bacterium]
QNEIVAYPHELPSYCQRIRKTKEGRLGCRQCDTLACQRAKKIGSAHIYTCHAGLTEAISPILINGKLLGYALLSHMTNRESLEETINTAAQMNAVYGLSKEETRRLIAEIGKTSLPLDADTISAATNILDALVSYVSMKKLIKENPDNIAFQLEQYIIAHLSEPLSCEQLCNIFHISRSCLFQISKSHFGMGISKYIRAKQIERAKELLTENNSITSVATQCGFSDVSYFSKVFKAETGSLPSKYEQRH